VKASVELCINKLSDAVVKFELKTNCEKFDSELEELGTLDGLADSCVSSDMAFLEGCRNISKLIVPTSPFIKLETGVKKPTTAPWLC